ncbi:hypothetical protein FQN51_004525 [Onygenales sp. PD_10]|nr:hypothetical protein FQN51_004525 [Onygenales sp. PD_10]
MAHSAPLDDEDSPEPDLESAKQSGLTGDQATATQQRGRETRVTFQPQENDPRQPNSSNAREGSRSRSRSRGDGRRSLGDAAAASIPIEFRTLSIQISESQNVTDIDTLKGRKQINVNESQDYFERLDFHTLDIPRLAQQFNVRVDQGLSTSAASTRLQRDGKNTVPQARDSYIKKVLGYVFGGFCSILWIGVIIFFVCWKPLSDPPSVTNLALAILVIIVILLQASFSAFQDWSTKRVMNSILNLLPSEALVLRDGNLTKLPATDLVAGDVVHISIGNKVPADMRIIRSSGDVRFDRSVLTGESDEIEGAIDSTDDNFLETRNIALMGTGVTNGNAVGIVVLTGNRTVMGRIATVTTGVKQKPTLIQREITRFVTIIVCLTVCLACLIMFSWAGWLRVKHPSFMNVSAMLSNVMGCVVAFIPEGMPIGVALALMMVANRMKNVNILPKGLATVETLGCVNVLCSDKTGTLTQNKMYVTSIGFVDKEYQVDELVAEIKGPEPSAPVRNLHQGSILCNDAFIDPASLNKPANEWNIHGNATDEAILRFAEGAKRGQDIIAGHDKVFQIPFNSKNKWMLTMHDVRQNQQSEKGGEYLVNIKGAPDVLLPKCSFYWSGVSNEVRPLDDAARQSFSSFQEKLSRKAERVIVLCQRHYNPQSAVGSNEFGDEIVTKCVTGLTVVGIYGIMDPPRAETAQTVAACRRAGIRFFMVTGDFGLTAAAIARSIGIYTGTAEPDRIDDLVYPPTAPDDDGKGKGKGKGKKQVDLPRVERSLLVEGSQILDLDDADWDAICCYEEIVFARTTPEQKLRIVNEFRGRDNVVAVTGDGVNDAPALRAADVGIAVVSGSDVAIEAADLVLMDKFDSIVPAIRLGRLVFQNLQKVIGYLLPAGSWSEIWPVLMNVFTGVPLPLSSFLMIIICVFTDLFLCLSLIVEKEEFDLLSLPPRNHKRDHLINAKIYAQSYLFVGVMETVTAHCMFFLYMYRKAGIPFHALVLAFEDYSEGFYGYTAEELTHFNNVGQCVYFVTLVYLQWGNILSIRNKRMSILQADPIRKQRRNPWLGAAMVVSLAIAIFVIEVPGINRLFNTAPIPIEYWFIPLPLSLGILMMDEIRKLVVRLFPKGLIARIAW